MGILSFLSGAIEPITGLIDKMHTSDAERGDIQIELSKLENVIKAQMLDLEGQRIELKGQLVQAKSAIIIAEAQSGIWITAAWRPLIMLEFGLLIGLIATGIMDTAALNAVPEQLWRLITLGIGGYMTLRTLDKAISKGGVHLFGKKKEEV